MNHRYITCGSIAALLGTTATAQPVFDLGEIVVTATTVPTEEARTGASVEVLTDEELETGGTPQLTDRLRSLPGVFVTQNGPPGTVAEFRLRGASESATAVYIDGIQVNDPSTPEGTFGNFGALGAGTLSRVEVLKGSQSALFGGSAVAGVVNIFTLPDADTPLGISQSAEFSFGSFNTVTASYGFVNKTETWTLNFGITHAQSSGFSAADEDLGNSEDDSFRETRLSFGASVQATEALRLGFNGFLTEGEADFDEFGFVPEDGTPGDETSTRDETGLRIFAEYDAGGAWRHEASLSYFEVEREVISATTSAPFASPFTSQFTGERIRFEYQATGQISDQVTLSLGGDFEEERSEDSSIPGGSADIQTRGLFAEALYAPTAALDLIGTIRLDDHSEFGSEVTGRLAFGYRPTTQLTFRGAIATGFRPPVASELFSSFPPFFSGNPDLQPETSLSYELGADFAFAGDGQISATLFRNEIDDMIAIDSTFSTLENSPGTSVLQGVELGMALPISEKVTLSGAYTFLDAQDEDGVDLARIAEHELYLALGADLTDRFYAELNVQYVLNRAPDTFPAQELPDFTVVNATMSYDVTDIAEAYLTIQNLFDEDYQTAAGFGTADRSVFVGIRASF